MTKKTPFNWLDKVASRQDNMATTILSQKGSLKLQLISSILFHCRKKLKNFFSVMSLSNLFSLQAIIEIRCFFPQLSSTSLKKKKKKDTAHKHIVKTQRLNYTNLLGSENPSRI